MPVKTWQTHGDVIPVAKAYIRIEPKFNPLNRKIKI